MKKILVILAVVVCGINTMVAQEKKESPWKEVQVVEIPAGQTVHEGVTKNGNPKFWFEFGEIKVNVSPGSASKYKANQVTLLLVKWQHSETGKYKYSTRQKSAAKKSTPNVDLNNLF
jgi:hypothetical protein